MKIVKLFPIFVCILFVLPNTTFAFAGGSGTSGSPYQITTPAELASMSSYLGAGNSGKYFKLMNDIDLNVSPYNTGGGWTPIGYSGNAFYGKFDGNYKTVSNIYISTATGDYQGLFGLIGSGGLVQNVVISSPNISADYGVGALAGGNQGTVTKAGVRNGSVAGTQRVGGLIGEDYGGISYSFASTTVNFNPQSSVTCCAGGLAGEVAFGGASAFINNSYSRSKIIMIYSAYNQGSIGGVLGNDYSSGTKTNLYSTGPITMVSGNFPSNVGGLSGGQYTSISSSYWDTESSGKSTSYGGAGVVGKTTAQMKTQSTYSGWDFSTVWGINASINDGYPYLLWTPDAPADSTPPTASTTAPVGGTVVSGSSVTISANATDDVSVAGVSFYINGVLQGSEDTSSPYSISWNSTATSSGQKTVLSVARDSSNNYATSSAVTFTVDNTAPTVSLTYPTSDEATSSVMTLIASASDAHSSVSGVKFYVDGVLQGSEDTSSPYSVSYDTTATTSGAHTAFAVARDASNNYATSSSVDFTVSNTGSTPGSISVTSTSGGAVFTWITASMASSRVWFGVIDNISSSTPETDTSPRVTNHSVTLYGLPSCTRYHFVISGRDAYLNSATSTDSTFKTGGCTGSSPISSTGDGSVSTNSGGSVVNDSLTLTIPPSFTSTTSAAVFQVNKLNKDNFFSSAGTPRGKSRASDSVFNLKALADATTTITSFIAPLTVTLSYTLSDIQGIDESTLQIYRYDSDSWHALSNCVVDKSAKTVTCNTSQFSDFALFGDAVTVSVTTTTSSSSSVSQGSNTIQGQVKTLIERGDLSQAKIIMNAWPHLFTRDEFALIENTTKLPEIIATSSKLRSYIDTSNFQTMATSSIIVNSVSTTTINTILRPQDTNPDVKKLQRFLNSRGFVVALSGPGSLGNETEYFGVKTELALKLFQEFYAEKILKPLGLKEGTGIVGPQTMKFINGFGKNDNI